MKATTTCPQSSTLSCIRSTPPLINMYGPDDVAEPPAKSVEFRPIDLDDL
jgi:hypothetical protein